MLCFEGLTNLCKWCCFYGQVLRNYKNNFFMRVSEFGLKERDIPEVYIIWIEGEIYVGGLCNLD